MNVTLRATDFEQTAAIVERLADGLSLNLAQALAGMRALSDHRDACAAFVNTLVASLSPEARVGLSAAFASWSAANDTFGARLADIKAMTPPGADDAGLCAPLRTMAATFREVARAACEAGTEATA